MIFFSVFLKIFSFYFGQLRRIILFSPDLSTLKNILDDGAKNSSYAQIGERNGVPRVFIRLQRPM